MHTYYHWMQKFKYLCFSFSASTDIGKGRVWYPAYYSSCIRVILYIYAFWFGRREETRMTLVTMASTFRSTPGRSRRTVNSWGPMSLPSEMARPGTGAAEGQQVPETEEEYVEYYQDRIYSSQSRQLYPLQEDLADWINKTLGKYKTFKLHCKHL